MHLKSCNLDVLSHFLWVEACWSVKKILKPAGASRKFEALLERQENFEAKNVSQDLCGKLGKFLCFRYFG